MSNQRRAHVERRCVICGAVRQVRADSAASRREYFRCRPHSNVPYIPERINDREVLAVTLDKRRVLVRCTHCSRANWTDRYGLERSGSRYCKACAGRLKCGNLYGWQAVVLPAGYQARKWSMPGTRERITVLEHRIVMEGEIGREMYPGENVHHRNGDRSDNRPENLELWSTSQPCGQRVEDKTAWAIEWLRLYAPEVLAIPELEAA